MHPFFSAISRGDVDTVQQFLRNQPGIVKLRDENNRTGLHFAAGKGHDAIVNLLLDSGCHVDGTNCNGCTPLLRALLSGHKDTAILLVRRSANIHKKDQAGRTALSICGDDAQLRSVLESEALSSTASFADPGSPSSYNVDSFSADSPSADARDGDDPSSCADAGPGQQSAGVRLRIAQPWSEGRRGGAHTWNDFVDSVNEGLASQAAGAGSGSGSDDSSPVQRLVLQRMNEWSDTRDKQRSKTRARSASNDSPIPRKRSQRLSSIFSNVAAFFGQSDELSSLPALTTSNLEGWLRQFLSLDRTRQRMQLFASQVLSQFPQTSANVEGDLTREPMFSGSKLKVSEMVVCFVEDLKRDAMIAINKVCERQKEDLTDIELAIENKFTEDMVAKVVESVFYPHVYQHVFAPFIEENLARDRKLHLEILPAVKSAESVEQALGVKADDSCALRAVLRASGVEFRRVVSALSPAEKIVPLVAMLQALSRAGSSDAKSAVCADEMVPLVSLCLARHAPLHWCAELDFISMMMDSSLELGECGYAVATLQVATEFLLGTTF
eukprot:Rmarinus@m.13326